MADHIDTSTQQTDLVARFDDPARMQDAASRLTLAGFDRAALSVPENADGVALDAAPAYTDEDARQARTLGASTAGSVAAMAAAGITIATGGAAAPAVIAALAAGGVLGGATYVAHDVANSAEQHVRDDRAAHDSLILSVRAATPEQRAQAEQILHTAGALSVETTGD
jgi:hypothetical protein